MLDPLIRDLVTRVAREHGAHTAILYGSYARGDATEKSDLDILFVRETGPNTRDARMVDGLYLDAFIYPEAALATPDTEMLRLVGARVVFEGEGFGTALLQKVQALYDRGPDPLAEDDRRMRRVWAQKSLARFRDEPGPAGEYRRMFLLIQSFEDYFALRTMWFRGSKQALAWLQHNDPAAYAAFETAMRRTATDDEIAHLVAVVYDAPDAASGARRA